MLTPPSSAGGGVRGRGRAAPRGTLPVRRERERAAVERQRPPLACERRLSMPESLRAPRGGRRRRGALRLSAQMSPTWIWMQIAIVVFVLIGMVIAITKLA